MADKKKRHHFSRGKKILFSLITVVLSLALSGFIGEKVARKMGYRPWSEPGFGPKVEPEGPLFTKHPTLGYTSLPGEFKVRIYPDFYFKMTHLSNTLRITHPLETYRVEETKKEIWVFGCSLTHGWSLNDNETYPWLLQEQFPDYEVVNFGVDGYSDVQSLVQFQEALGKGKKPVLMVLAYASFHDERNALLRSWRKKIRLDPKLNPLTPPYAKITRDGKLEIVRETAVYREFPLMRRSAFVNALEDAYDNLEGRFSESHEISKAVIKEFSRLCQANGIKLVVAGIFPDAATAEMLDYCRSEGIMATDISVDYSIKENTNLPYDPHPSAAANRQIARKLASFLSEQALK